MNPVATPFPAEFLGREKVPAHEIARLPGRDEVDPIEPYPRLSVAQLRKLDIVEFNYIVVRGPRVRRNRLSVQLWRQTLPLGVAARTKIIIGHAATSSHEVGKEIAESGGNVHNFRTNGLEYLG